MGIDTVKLSSPPIAESLAQLVDSVCTLRQGIELITGNVLYEITSGQLDGSYDSRISLKVMRERYQNLNGRPDLYPCEPYIELECSIHKVFFGQNIYGSPVGFREQIARLINNIEFIIRFHTLNEFKWDFSNPEFPNADLWTVHRVDWAEVYRLTPDAISEFFRSMSHSKFPRRGNKAAKYGTNALHFPGDTTTLKLYHKGPEFRAHDVSRVRKTLCMVRRHKLVGTVLSDDATFRAYQEVDRWVDRRIAALKRLADNRLRVECGIHAKKFRAIFDGELPKVAQITDALLKHIHDEELAKLLKEGKSDMETVRNHEAVKNRLIDVYGSRTANSLICFWMRMASEGEDVVFADETYSRSQFYANRKKLVQAGVSWLSSNVMILPEQTALPRDFKPFRTDMRLCGAPVRQASIFDICPVGYQELKLAA